MKLSQAVKDLTVQLQPLYGDGEAAAIAALALEEVTGWERAEQLRNAGQILSVGEMKAFETLTQRLLRHEPLQYITGRAPFYGLMIYVDKHVLIPRPETEELVDWIVRDVRTQWGDRFQKEKGVADATTTLKMLDVGTGSGCIALALKKALPLAEVWGCDSSDEALNVARRNGSELDVRVDFQSLNFLDVSQQKQLPTVDILVSNPPYIPRSDQGSMHPNVVQYEPHQALFVPDEDPLIFYKAILKFSKHRLYENATVYLEIHEDRGAAVKNLFEEEGWTIEIKKDMQGKDRMVRARRAKPS